MLYPVYRINLHIFCLTVNNIFVVLNLGLLLVGVITVNIIKQDLITGNQKFVELLKKERTEHKKKNCLLTFLCSCERVFMQKI